MTDVEIEDRTQAIELTTPTDTRVLIVTIAAVDAIRADFSALPYPPGTECPLSKRLHYYAEIVAAAERARRNGHVERALTS